MCRVCKGTTGSKGCIATCRYSMPNEVLELIQIACTIWS